MFIEKARIPHDAEPHSSQLLNKACAYYLRVNPRELVELITTSILTEKGGEL